jgi:hypothetical protein
MSLAIGLSPFMQVAIGNSSKKFGFTHFRKPGTGYFGYARQVKDFFGPIAFFLGHDPLDIAN